MNTKALITLEYDKIIKKLETFASSTMGKALCKDLLPSSDYEEILSAQTETKDALTSQLRGHRYGGYCLLGFVSFFFLFFLLGSPYYIICCC